MPFKIVKHNNKFSVENKNTGKVYSKGTTLIKAKKQVRLLGMIEGMEKTIR